MQVLPAFAPFVDAYDAGRPQVAWTTLVADLETPVSAYLKLADGRSNSFLLESVTQGTNRGRYSFIGLNPDVIWRCRGKVAEVNRRAQIDPEAFEPCALDSLASFRALIRESRIDLPDDLPPMSAGLIGYMSYDMVRQIESLPDGNPDEIGLPDGIFLRPTVIAVFDTIEDVVTVITPVWPDPDNISAAAAYDLARARLADVMANFQRSLPYRRERPATAPDLGEPLSNMTREQFHAMIGRAKDYILAGDIFQVVLSQRFRLPFTLPPFALYRALRRLNPSPYLFNLDFGRFSIVGSSPEVLVRVRDGQVTIRPIAGTRPRGASPAEDRALAEDLLNDEKERAEHLMLLDLGRNDVGRVAKVGSVRVTEEFVIENYSHVMHIVSNVTGELDRDRADELDALFGGFPAGTVSGAPKIRAMEIIDELEPERRGFYAGCIGYFGADGDMDTCIALRTALIKDGVLYAQAGGGIVFDSTPEGEYQESLNKARAIVRAVEEAVRFASRD